VGVLLSSSGIAVMWAPEWAMGASLARANGRVGESGAVYRRIESKAIFACAVGAPITRSAYSGSSRRGERLTTCNSDISKRTNLTRGGARR
jgi:hypothetical protein